jgi:hypothetical protein
MVRYAFYYKEDPSKVIIGVKDNLTDYIYNGTFILPEVFKTTHEFYNFLIKNKPIYELYDDKLLLLFLYRESRIKLIEFILNRFNQIV